MNKCYLCNSSKIECNKLTVATGWEDYKLTVNNVDSYICGGCGVTAISGCDSIMLERFSKGMAELDKNKRLSVIDFEDIKTLINMSE